MDTEMKSALLRVMPFIIIFFVLVLQIKKGKISGHDLFINKPSSINRFLGWVICFLMFVLLVEFALFTTGFLETDPWKHPFLPSVIRILGAVILAPIVEELIFRGLFLRMLLKRKLNLHLAIFIQAGVFVLLHNFTWQNTLSSNIGIIQSLTDAVLFGYAKQHTKSIYTPVAMHISGNFIATVERFIL